ncbi:hypothetical protein [Aeromonas salmonicida]|uniref:hypothetical protein n=1 Tax=Aeromonas salmonicida TaxID=645 RepID=UPI00283AAD24|nr:hypothetical protein [Aeromonas salmonicida]
MAITIGYGLLALLAVGICLYQVFIRLNPEAKTVRKGVKLLSRALGIKSSLVSRMMMDLGPKNGYELCHMVEQTKGNTDAPFHFIYECGALIFFFHWCLYKTPSDVHWLHQHLAKQGFSIDQISMDEDALGMAQSILSNIDLRGYDLHKLHKALSAFIAKFEEYLDSDGSQEPPRIVLD